jgi:hypothetical protein
MTKSSPPLRVYSAETISEKLRETTKEYLEQNVSIDFQKKTVIHRTRVSLTLKITLPKIMDWFSSDFGSSKEEIFVWLMKNIYQTNIRLKEPLDTKYSINFKNFEWSFYGSFRQ